MSTLFTFALAIILFGINSTNAESILMVVTSKSTLGDSEESTGAWLSEVSHPYYVFRDAGFDITFISPKGGKPPFDPRSLASEDSVDTRFLTDETATQLLAAAIRPEEVVVEDFDAVFFCGGHGTMWDFPENEVLAGITAKLYESGGVVGAVCHGPAGLVNVMLSSGSYLLADRQVTAFSNSEERARGLDTIVPFLLESAIEARGAHFSAAENWQEHVVVDGRLVTGQNPASAAGVAEELVSILLARRSAKP